MIDSKPSHNAYSTIVARLRLLEAIAEAHHSLRFLAISEKEPQSQSPTLKLNAIQCLEDDQIH